jgi:PAS domain S-box-containing protein
MAAKKKNKNEGDIADIHSLPDHTQEQLALPLKGSPDLAEQSKEQLINKLQDLQIHLEIQAKELLNSHLALEVSRDKYLDLYDFAPLGYLTLNDNALITDVNLTGAMLFGAERNEIINHRFEQFIAPEDFERWYKFFAILKSQHIKKQVCTFMFIRDDGSTFPAQLDGVRTVISDGAIEIHIAITDITDISEAEKALRESEEKYRDIFENSVTGLFKTKPEGTLIAINDAFARIYDYSSAAEMIADNQKLENLYISSTLYANPEDRKEIYRILAEKGKVENFETLHCKRDGTRIWMSITARVVRDPEGTVLFVEGTIIDITERKLAEEAVRESENRYRTLIENMPDGLILHSPSGKILYANSSAASLLHLQNPGVLTDKNVLEFVDPDYRDKVSARMEEAIEKGEPIPLQEEVLIRSDGTRVTVENQGCRVLFRGEYATQVVVRDITERKRAEEKLRVSEQKYREIFENSVFGLFQTAPGGRIINVNNAFARMYGFSDSAEMLAADLDVGSPPYANPEDHQEVLRILMQKGKVENYETLHCKRDGTRFWASITARTIRDNEGNVLLYEGTILDITKRKMTEEVVRASHDQLTKSEADLRIHQTELEMQSEELRKSKIALEESRDKFIDLYEFAPLGYLTLNDKALITEVNLTSATLLGIERSKLINARFRKFIAQPDQDVWDRYFMHVLNQDNKQTCSLSLNRSDGSMFPARLESIRIIGIDGTPTVRVAVSDITDIQKAEEALLLEKNYSDRMFDAPHDTVFLFEPSTGKPIRWNKRFSEESGYTDDEIAGMKAPRDFYDKADLNKATEAMARNYTENVTVELSLVTKQGAHIPFEYSATPIETTDGKTLLLSIGRNITERKQAEENLVATLKRTQDQQAALGEISFSPHLFSGDVHGLSARLTEVSCGVLGVERASVWLFNNNEDELRCIDLYEVMYDRHSYEGILKRREYVNEFEALSTAKFIDADDPLTDPRTAGYVKSYLKPNRITSMLDAVIRVSGQNLGVLCFEHVDCSHHWESDEIAFACQLADQIAITLLNRDRKRAEEALHLANKKLTLLSGITRHDINNQMTVLMGYLTIMEKKQTEPMFNEYFGKVSTAAQRISSMVQFTKEYESIGVKAPAWQDCRTLVDTAAKDAPLGKVVVKNDLPSGAEVFADPLVVKVCTNLMDNAVRYGGKITTIRFSVEEAGDDHLIVCEDDGDGIVAEEKEKIFERGFGKNTGLGLALSREILDITGITLRETGEPGKGARFEIVVPKGMWRFKENNT